MRAVKISTSTWGEWRFAVEAAGGQCWPELLHCVFFLPPSSRWSAPEAHTWRGLTAGWVVDVMEVYAASLRAPKIREGKGIRALHAGDTLSPPVQLSSTNITFYCEPSAARSHKWTERGCCASLAQKSDAEIFSSSSPKRTTSSFPSACAGGRIPDWHPRAQFPTPLIIALKTHLSGETPQKGRKK